MRTYSCTLLRLCLPYRVLPVISECLCSTRGALSSIFRQAMSTLRHYPARQLVLLFSSRLFDRSLVPDCVASLSNTLELTSRAASVYVRDIDFRMLTRIVDLNSVHTPHAQSFSLFRFGEHDNH